MMFGKGGRHGGREKGPKGNRQTGRSGLRCEDCVKGKRVVGETPEIDWRELAEDRYRTMEANNNMFG